MHLLSDCGSGPRQHPPPDLGYAGGVKEREHGCVVKGPTRGVYDSEQPVPVERLTRE